MPRFALELSYNGNHYHGWQCQKNAESVQEVIEAKLFQLLQQNIKIFGCGRTDAGVHAKNYIAHFDVVQLVDDFVFKLNKVLPSDIGVIDVYEVPKNFNARFDAHSRTYIYTVTSKKEVMNGGLMYWDRRHYNIDLMNAACNIIKQTEDFGAFCKLKSENKTNRCDVRFAEWTRSSDRLIFEVTADRFLRNMVRAMVGTLLDLGRNRITLADFESIVSSQKRENASASAPAQGLMLTEVVYDRSKWKLII